AEVAEDAHTEPSPEDRARDAGHVVAGDGLDPADDLVQGEPPLEVDLLASEVAHPAARVLEGEHEAALEVVLGPPQLLLGQALAPDAPELLEGQPHDLVDGAEARARVDV